MTTYTRREAIALLLMIPTLAERLEASAAELKVTLPRTQEVPVSKFGISPNASAARNAKALNDGIATVDDGTILMFGSGTYPIERGVVRGMRGSIELRGDGYQRAILEYTSTTDQAVGTGDCIIFGIDKLELVPAGATGVCKDVTVRGLGFRDLNRVPFDFAKQTGHWPAALEMIFVENAHVDACGFQNVKGNSALNMLGASKSQFEGLTQLATVSNCWFGGDALGGYTQGDAANVGCYAKTVLTGNRTEGGIKRHFLELGSGIVDLMVEDNVGDMKNEGLAHVASITCSRSGSIRRNVFSNWGAAGGASSIVMLPDSPQYDAKGNSIFTAPDGTPLLLNKIVGMRLEDNTFNGGPTIWPPAILVEDGDLHDHAYRRNTFNCMLPMEVVKQPVDGFEISDNDFYPVGDGRALITLAEQLQTPSGPATIEGNRLHSKTAKLFDRGNWASDARVQGLATNVIGA